MDIGWVLQVNLKREKLDVNPVFSTAMLDDEGNKLGYIRLVNFSQKAAQEVERSMRRFEVKPVAESSVSSCWLGHKAAS